jgi:hypothetical protein
MKKNACRDDKRQQDHRPALLNLAGHIGEVVRDETQNALHDALLTVDTGWRGTRMVGAMNELAGGGSGNGSAVWRRSKARRRKYF